MPSVNGVPSVTRAIPLGLCQCGCGTPTRLAPQSAKEKGWIRGQPLRFALGHNGYLLHPGYVVDEVSGCWIWQGGKTRGYGRHTRARRPEMVHRTYYLKYVGPIPDGFEIDHICRNRGCVNPAHLEAVTPTVNMRRRPDIKVTETSAAAIREAARDGESQRHIARRFGISKTQVANIVTRRHWK